MKVYLDRHPQVKKSMVAPRSARRVILNRSRAYHDDPMWILNKACEKYTGQSLPSGFYPDKEWKWIELDGKKEWIRKPALEDYASKKSNPLQSTHYFGLETKIMRINLFEELKGLYHTKFNNYRESHLHFFYLDAWYNVCKVYNARGGDKPEYTPECDNDTTFVEWWFANRTKLICYLFRYPKSPLYINLRSRDIKWITTAIQEYITNNLLLCCNQDKMMEVLNNPQGTNSWDDRKSLNLPQVLRWKNHPLKEDVKTSSIAGEQPRYPDIVINKSAVREWRQDNHNFKDFAYEHILPALIPKMSNETGWETNLAQGFFKSFKNDGIPKYQNKPDTYDIIHHTILKNVKQKITSRSNPQRDIYRPDESNLQYQNHTPRHHECQNGKVKTGKKNWSPWFWKTALKTTAFEICDGTIEDPNNGSWDTLGGKTKRASRYGMWEFIKKESGLLSEDENYYKHKDYEKTFKGMMVEEAIRVL